MNTGIGVEPWTLRIRKSRALFAFYLRLTGQRPLSEDLVQEVFLRVLRYAGSFHPEAPFKPWFYRIARRVHLDHRGRPEKGDWVWFAESVGLPYR